jgi:hypothetical protein
MSLPYSPLMDEGAVIKGALKKCRKGVFGITVSAKNQETKGLPR